MDVLSKATLLTATLLTATSALIGCVPDVEVASTRVDAPRVLAVRAEPAELELRVPVTFTALYADGEGTLQEAPLDWAFCLERKALSELGPISSSCLVKQGDALVPLGEGVSTQGELPKDACRLFGPDRPPPKAGEPAGRPVDPDPTGGYYQPLRLFDAEQDAYAIYAARIACGLPGASQALAAEWNRRRAPNTNPEIEALEADGEALVPDDAEQALNVEAGQEVALRLRWSECDVPDPCSGDDCEPLRTCTGAESYLAYDATNNTLVQRREAMRVSWFASDGTFSEGRTGRNEGEADETDSDDTWTAPDAQGEVTLWVVLRDDRGGTAWHSYHARVER